MSINEISTLGSGTSSTVIAAEGIGKTFGELQVLKDVSLPVRRGEVVCVVGPSGSGKTTLLRTLALLETPTAGRVTMDGIVISDGLNASGVRKAAARVRPDIGMVFQHFNLWPHRSVIENVIEAPILVRRMRRQDAIELAMELLDKVGLADKHDVYPGRLSGGQQQRVAIARALAMRPRIMLFDEATSALDPELRHEVLRVMRQLAEDGMTMLVVTHEMGFARNVGSRIVFMDGGTIIEDTLPETFFTAPGTERAVRFLRQLQD